MPVEPMAAQRYFAMSEIQANRGLSPLDHGVKVELKRTANFEKVARQISQKIVRTIAMKGAAAIWLPPLRHLIDICR